MSGGKAFFILGLTLPVAYCTIDLDMYDEAGLIGETKRAASGWKARVFLVISRRVSELTAALVNTGIAGPVFCETCVRSLSGEAEAVLRVFFCALNSR